MKLIFSEKGYKLEITKFINNSQKLKCVCPNNHEWETTLSRFLFGSRCKRCSGKEKHSYEYVKYYFSRNECELLSDTYTDNNQLLEYKCSCGNVSKIRFRSFLSGQKCNKCSTKRAIDSNKSNHNGKLYFQTKEAHDRKKQILKENPQIVVKTNIKRKETCLKKYGSNTFLNSKIGKKQSKQSLLKRYGVESSLAIPSAMKKFKQTLMSKYGVPSLAFLSRPASKQSQKLFWAVYKNIPIHIQEKSYFAELNKEFVVTNGTEHYKFDFVNTKLKKAIEFNGKNFHPSPEQSENETNWCAFHPNKTVKEAREYEKRKYKTLETRGFKILTVWDYEYRKDFENLTKQCVNFLTQENPLF